MKLGYQAMRAFMEMADILAKKGEESIMVGPGGCGIAFSNSKGLVKNREKSIRNITWRRGSGLRLSKMFISPYAKGWAALLDQSITVTSNGCQRAQGAKCEHRCDKELEPVYGTDGRAYLNRCMLQV
ncbi:hypothetical protein J6590_005469 [Homalodisca vitripennis]|nr:hypothetical protein J6590_005469 [Homalodisca vitripennis]